MNEEIFGIRIMIALAARTIQKTEILTILRRTAEKDKTAVKDCIDAYGNFIRATARKFTASREEADAATTEIFSDIWRSAERARNPPQSTEEKLIAMIALRRLIKSSRQAKQKSMTSIDAPNEQGAGMGRISESV